MAEICRGDGMPGLRTVYDWMGANKVFAARIARAREAGYDAIATDALLIADTPLEGVRVVTSGAGKKKKVEVYREDMLGHRRLQVETRLKLLAKWDPKRYGDSTTLKGDADAPLYPPAIVVPRKELPGASAAARHPLAAKPKAR